MCADRLDPGTVHATPLPPFGAATSGTCLAQTAVVVEAGRAMDQMRFEQSLACSPEEAWPHLTLPEQMNAWSEAEITLLEPGENGAADSVGTVRQVCIPGLVPMRLTERVVLAERPTDFRYRVIAGGMLRKHEGRIQLSSQGEGRCLLRWTVDFVPLIPATGWIAKRLVGRAMGPSLAKLATLTAR